MKIVHMIPGSGGTFYCQNCLRDSELIRALKSYGHDILMSPMYLPLNVDDEEKKSDTPIFYGAINVYLEEKFPLFRHIPRWIEKLLDAVANMEIDILFLQCRCQAFGDQWMTVRVPIERCAHQGTGPNRLASIPFGESG